VPFKHHLKGRRHIPQQRHRVTNWRDYDAALRNRGSLTVWFSEEALPDWSRVLRFRRRLPLAPPFSGELDPVGVMDDSVEDGLGERREANHIVPAIDGNLAGDDEGAFVVSVLDDFEERYGRRSTVITSQLPVDTAGTKS
jgi:hypothetical protein